MNKELIKKYKSEFDYFLNEGKVILGARDLQTNKVAWYRSVKNPFLEESTSSELLVIKDDAYVEFRTALAEGKTIQVNNLFDESWTDIKDVKFTGNVKMYRIKPEELKQIKSKEPEFKIGDWLINEKPDYNFGKEPSKPFIVTQDWIDYISKFGKTFVGNTAETVPLENFKHWEPKPGEWCWFFNDDIIPTISQFVEINEDMTRKYFAVLPNRPHALGSWYKRCEPFIGTLPTNLQD